MSKFRGPNNKSSIALNYAIKSIANGLHVNVCVCALRTTKNRFARVPLLYHKQRNRMNKANVGHFREENGSGNFNALRTENDPSMMNNNSCKNKIPSPKWIVNIHTWARPENSS